MNQENKNIHLPKVLSVTTLVLAFDNLMQLQNLAISTRKTYCGHVRLFLRHFKRNPSEIKFQEIRDYLLSKKFVPKTRDQAKFAINKFYSEVMQELRPLTSLPNAKKPYKLPKFLSVHEIMAITNAITNLKHRAAIQLMYAGALRRSELLNIRFRHLDSKNGTLFIEQSKGAKDRLITLPADTFTVLASYYKKFFVGKKVSRDDFLFPGQGNQQYSEGSLRSILKRAATKANILKYVCLHVLRHSRATHLVMGGVDIHTLADFLGHWDIRTTRIYLHTTKKTMQNKIITADAYLQKILANHHQSPPATNPEQQILTQIQNLLNTSYQPNALPS